MSSSGLQGVFAGSAALQSRENALSDVTIDDFGDEIRGLARARTERLETLADLSPEARPGLAVCRALEASYAGDLDEVERRLGEALDALGGEPGPVADARIGGAR